MRWWRLKMRSFLQNNISKLSFRNILLTRIASESSAASSSSSSLLSPVRRRRRRASAFFSARSSRRAPPAPAAPARRRAGARARSPRAPCARCSSPGSSADIPPWTLIPAGRRARLRWHMSQVHVLRDIPAVVTAAALVAPTPWSTGEYSCCTSSSAQCCHWTRARWRLRCHSTRRSVYTYFFERNGLLKVLHVFGDQCVPYENIDEQSLYRLTREHDWIHRLWTPPPPPEGASSLQPVLHHAVVVSAQIFDS